MNSTIALQPQPIGSVGLNDLLALIGLPLKRKSADELSGAVGEILKGISSFLDGLLLRAIAARTDDEFVAARTELFSQYAGALTPLARLVRIVVPDATIERVLSDSFCELEAEFREQGATRFGVPARDQAMFTVWTLRRTTSLIAKIAASGSANELSRDQDEKVAKAYTFYALWTQFHLDCLLAAIRFDKPVQLEVLPAVIDGLRAAVNAYGYAREGLNLRVPEKALSIAPYEWDEEDQELLEASMRDLEAHAIDD